MLCSELHCRKVLDRNDFSIRFRVWCLGFRFQVWGFGFRAHVSHATDEAGVLEFRVSGFRIRVPGSGIRVSGFGFRVPGFGFRLVRRET